MKLSKADAMKMRASPIPTYLIGVDDRAEEAYIVSIHGGLRAAVSSIPTTYPLNAANSKILYDEVKPHWASLAPLSRGKVSAFQI